MNKSTHINRRRFLLLAGGTLGSSLLLCGSVAWLDTQTPVVKYAYESCGKENAMKKVLVVYASKYGSTGEVAQAIATHLCQRGASADVRRVEEVTDVETYDAVVVGSAVRMGQWLPPAVEFVGKHVDALRKLPTAFFTVHMMALDDSEASRSQRASYMDPVHAYLTAQNEAFFAGKIDPSKLSFGDRLMTKLVRAATGDARNWQTIQAWANAIPLT